MVDASSVLDRLALIFDEQNGFPAFGSMELHRLYGCLFEFGVLSIGFAGLSNLCLKSCWWHDEGASVTMVKME
jgi:hypothetical protein